MDIFYPSLIAVLLVLVANLVAKNMRIMRSRWLALRNFSLYQESVEQIRQENAENRAKIRALLLEKFIQDQLAIWQKDEIERLRPLAAMAGKDVLTGLPNRGYFDEKFNELQSRFHSCRVPRKDSILSVGFLMFDVDNFKPINDTYGHFVGDLVLKAVAEAIRNCFRPGDVCRWGGEEFVALLTDVTFDQANDLAEKARQAVESAEIFLEDGRRINATVSIGVAFAKSSEEIPGLKVRADAALYQAKDTGKNKVVGI